MLGGVLQLGVQVPALKRLGLLPLHRPAAPRLRARPGAMPACAGCCG